MQIKDLSTPSLLIDLGVMERNLARTIESCRASGVAYRPHVKTHKVTRLAAEQVKAGATGITCAKVGEAEVMVRAGLSDVFIAYPVVGRCRFERILALSEQARVSVGVDSLQVAKEMSEFFRARHRQIEVLLEIDSGHHRCGVTPESALRTARALNAMQGIRLKGIFTHEGHVYRPGTLRERLCRAQQAGKTMAGVAADLRAHRIGIEVVSVGSSPAQDSACKVEGVTENRPGTNIFNDATQVYLGACGWKDCAVSLLCTVVSRPCAERMIIDGGSKTFTSDHLSEWPDFGHLPGVPGARFKAASEEHGIIALNGDRRMRRPVGSRVRVIPSHVCGSINLHDRVFAVRGNRVVEELKVDARGCVD